MEWESKFSSIVKETETNLAKVKQRLNSSRNVSFANSFGPSSSSPFTITATSTTAAPYSGIPSSLPSNLASSTPGWMLHGDLSSSQPPMVASPALDTTLMTTHIDQSPAVSIILSERIEAQAKTIANLNGTIQMLESERDQFNRKLKQISDDVAAVNSRVAERGVHLGTERKVEQWKQEVMTELGMLRNAVHRNQDTSTQPMDNIYHMKRIMKDEFESLRRDIDYIKGRMDKVESSLARMERGNRDSTHRQDRLESSLHELGALQRNTSQNLMTRSVDQSTVGSLRNSLKFLEDKLSHLEAHVQSSPQPTKQSPKRPRKKYMTKRTSSDLLTPNLSDIDLSDDLSDLDLDDTEMLSLAYKEDDVLHPTDRSPGKRRKGSKYRDEEEEYEFSDPGVTSLGLLSDLQSGELGNLSGDTLDHTLDHSLDHSLDHTLSIDEL